MTELTNKQINVDNIFKPINGISDWIKRDELIGTPLELTNNGNSRHGIFYNDYRYIWDVKRKGNNKTGKVISLRLNGYNENNKKDRSIRNDIYDKIIYKNKKENKKNKCVICGTKDILCDHKNDLYNDKRVLHPWKFKMGQNHNKICFKV